MPLTPDRIAYLQQWVGYRNSSLAEAAVAAAFIEQFADRYDDFDFQVAVGEGVKLPSDVHEKWRRQWDWATRKRVDLVGRRGQLSDLIELKDHAAGDAIRQVRQYGDLWPIQPGGPLGDLYVAARTTDPGCAIYAESLGVHLVLLPLAPPAIAS